MKVKVILNYFIGFIISILITLAALSLISKFTIFNKDYLINLLEKENYYEKVYNEIKEEMENDIMPSGFTNDIIKDAIHKEEVKKDIIIFINNIFNGKKTVLEKTVLKEKIVDNINNFLKKSNLKITDNNGVNSFVDDLVKIYQNEICLYSYADGFINIFYKLHNMINKIVIIILIVLFITVFLAKLLLNFNYLSCSISASGLIILFLKLFIYEKIDADLLLVITENFSEVLTSIINKIGDYLLFIGIGLVISGILVSCQVFFKKCQEKNKVQ